MGERISLHGKLINSFKKYGRTALHFDLDAATLYATSMMNLSPWDYWNIIEGSLKANTTVIIDTLQSVVDREPKHAGALHYYNLTVYFQAKSRQSAGLFERVR